MKSLIIILCVAFCLSCSKPEKNIIIGLSEINNNINFIDNFPDELIDKKIKMGMTFDDLDMLFNNTLESDILFNNTLESDFGIYKYSDTFSPYFENEQGHLSFFTSKDYGLYVYEIVIVTEDDELDNKFMDCVSLLNHKYGEVSKDKLGQQYWMPAKNNLPIGILELQIQKLQRNIGSCIVISYFGENYIQVWANGNRRFHSAKDTTVDLFRINNKINFIDNHSDELLDKKIKMGMDLDELNNIFDNELEINKDISLYETGYYHYYNDFLQYYEKGQGYLSFSIDKDYGLLDYTITMYQSNDEKTWEKFRECMSILELKYGESSFERNSFIHKWSRRKNNIPHGVNEVRIYFREDGDWLRVCLSYLKK